MYWRKIFDWSKKIINLQQLWLKNRSKSRESNVTWNPDVWSQVFFHSKTTEIPNWKSWRAPLIILLLKEKEEFFNKIETKSLLSATVFGESFVVFYWINRWQRWKKVYREKRVILSRSLLEKASNFFLYCSSRNEKRVGFDRRTKNDRDEFPQMGIFWSLIFLSNWPKPCSSDRNHRMGKIVEILFLTYERSLFLILVYILTDL